MTTVIICNCVDCTYNQKSAYNYKISYCIRPEIFITLSGSCGMFRKKWDDSHDLA